MTYGMQVGGVHRTRAYTGENTGGFAKTAEVRAAAAAPVEAKVTVEAVLGAGGTHVLTIESQGQRAVVKGVTPDELADELARVINAVSKAVRSGDLVKHHQRDSAPLGIFKS